MQGEGREGVVGRREGGRCRDKGREGGAGRKGVGAGRKGVGTGRKEGSGVAARHT